MQAKKYDLKQLTFIATTTATNFGLVTAGAEGVPPNMKRYVVYANYYNPSAYAFVTLWERIGTTDRIMDKFGLTQYQERNKPTGGVPDPEKPVYVFRASSYIRCQTSAPLGGTGNVEVTMQVYDEPG